MKKRRECPICHVESPGGKVCGYHRHARARHQEGAATYRAEHYTQLLSEYVDEARNATGK